MHNTTFKTRIFLCFLAVILVTMVLPGVYVRQDIKQDGIEETIRSAQREAALIAQILGANQSTDNVTAVLTDLGTRLGFRITYIGLDGTVLADSDSGQHKLSELDNHADRQEVIEALHGTTGVSIRHSNTLDADLVYVALPFAAVGERPAGLIRVAVPLKRVEERIALAESQWFGILALGTVLALLLAFALSARLERSLKEMIRVVEGIAAAPAVSEEVEAGVSHPEQAPVVLNRRRLHIVPGREFRRLARAVNDMADRIEDDLRTIAEHKAQLETILDSMDEGVLVIGAAGRIRLVNPALVRFFPQTVHAVGRLPVEVLPIAELQQALDELLARPLSCSLEGAVQDRLVSTLEVEPTHDTVFSVHLIRPRCAVNGVLAVAVFHDVSETARLLRVRREFVANVSHELRTPLTAITGYAETLRDTPPEDAATCVRFAEIILRHARLMGSMVEDLLNLSRLESGAVPLSPVPLRASVVVAEVANACQPLFVARKLSLVVAVDTTVMIRADSHFIAQVFRNLLENACRYAPEGTAITVTGKTHPGAHDEGEALVVFTVKDEGPGIPSSALTRVFERFYRVEKHRGGAGGGSTGLGLAICKHIVERHNGRIWADAGPCGVFHFTVPSC